jgi:O-antigen biosynthesis protein
VLMECLASIFANVRVGVEIVVVDNASGDGIAGEIAGKHPSVKVVGNSDNAGFARACNQGVAATSAPYVLFLNPDTEVPEGSLEKMLEFMESHPETGIGGPLTKNTDGSIEPSVYNFPTPLRTLVDVMYLDNFCPRIQGYERKFFREQPEHERVQVICGACLLTRRALLEKLGSFDEELWMYGEDVELCWRFARAGHPAMFLKDCHIIHKRGEKHLEAGTAVDMSRVIYWHYRWIFHFHEKHSGPLTRMIMRRLLYVNIVMKYKPRKKKAASGGASRDNVQRVAAFEKLLSEFYGRKFE